jgi:fructokinase
MRKVIGVGETLLDIVFTDNQPLRAVPGGSVFNAFVSLGRLGVPLAYLSELGNDRVGDLIIRFMEENHIPADCMDRFSGGKSPVSLAFLNEEHNAEYLFYHSYPDRRLTVPFPEIKEDDIVLFGSYYALHPALHERIVELLEYARERNAIIYYDPNFRKAHAHEAIRLTPAVLDNFEYADIIRGSEEDFFNLFGKTDTEEVYNEHVRFYCKRFIATHGGEGVDLFTESFRDRVETPFFTPVSTIGAGDNFNAGIIYALLKYGIRKNDLPDLSKDMWRKIIRIGIDLAREACLNYDNYIPADFASDYLRRF